MGSRAEAKAKGFMTFDENVKKINIYEIGSRNNNDVIELVALDE